MRERKYGRRLVGYSFYFYFLSLILEGLSYVLLEYMMAEDLLLSEGGCAALQAAAPPTCDLIGRLLHFYTFFILYLIVLV